MATLSLTTPLLTTVEEADDLLTEAAVTAILQRQAQQPAYPVVTIRGIVDFVKAYSRRTGIRASVVLGQMLHETNWFRFGGDVRPNQFNFAGLGATGGGTGGASFSDPRTGVEAVFAHHLYYLLGDPAGWPLALRDYAATDPRGRAVLESGHAGKVRTIGDYTNGRWAYTKAFPVGSLENGYARAVAATANTVLLAAAREVVAMGHVPHPPFVQQRLIVKQNGAGVTWIAAPRVPHVTVLHSMVGTLDGTDGYFRQPGTQALTDFGVGRSADPAHPGYAKVYQWNDYRSRQVGWASGPVRPGHMIDDGPACIATWGSDPNIYGISIERDDAGTLAPATAEQWSSLCYLLAYLHDVELGQTAGTLTWGMHHREFCGPDYKDCPHPPIYTHTAEYQEAVRAIMRHWQEGVPYPGGGVKVAGLTLAVPTRLGPVADQSPYTFPNGKTIKGWFRVYFENMGGLPIFGLPITDEMVEGGNTVQYFERWRMQLVGSAPGALQGGVVGGLVGSEAYAARYGATQRSAPERTLADETS